MTPISTASVHGLRKAVLATLCAAALLPGCASQGDTAIAYHAPVVAAPINDVEAASPGNTAAVSAAPAQAVTPTPAPTPAEATSTPEPAATAATAVPQTVSEQGGAVPSAPADGMPAPEDVDIDAIYGNAVQGVASDDRAPRLAIDPWERFNRRVHAINNVLDRRVIRPAAIAYVRVVPTRVRDSVANFFRNLSGPVHTVNAALQGKFDQAGGALFRFLVNSTFGVAGLFDVATRMQIPDKSEDFGQTLAKWGWKRSRYLELPLFGPRTVRDLAGFSLDSQLNPWQGARTPSGQVVLQTVQVVNVRAQLLSTDTMRENAHDDYSLFRDAWWQRRNYQIWGEEREAQGVTLPPMVPGAGPSTKP